MKFSQFNTIIPFDDNFALYNAFSQKIIFLVPELKELLEAAVAEGIDELDQFHPEFYRYLVDHEYLVNNDEDEVLRVKKLSEAVDNESKRFILTINPTMNCNFKCWYCYETHIKQSRVSVSVVDKIKRFIANITSSGIEDLSLSFFGGEPLLYFTQSVVPIIDFAHNSCIKNNVKLNISFTTNGFLIDNNFIDYFHNLQLECYLQITLDGHADDHDKVRFVNANKGSYKQIVENIKLLIRNNLFVRVRVNYTDKNIVDACKIVEDFKDLESEGRKRYLFFDLHRVWQNSKEGDIDDLVTQTVNHIRASGFDVKSNSPNNVRDSCYADKRNSAVINYNADIYKCTARDFTAANRVGYLSDNGELIWENNHLEKRMNSKFQNKPCLTCRIMPLCNGGCSQHALEREGEDYCIYNGDENQKNNVVLSKVEEIVKSIYIE